MSGTRVAADRAESKPAQLHISHSWGGGIGRWVADFCKADGDRHNLVLQSVSDRNWAAMRLELLDPRLSDRALAQWTLAAPIRATDIRNPEYARILEEILDVFGIDVVVVSSLIGHSFEALATRLPTVLIAHDLYPFCPALFACFGEPCSTCEPARLARCMAQNPYNEFWHGTKPAQWIALREAYVESASEPNVRLVAPSRSVRDRLCALLPQLHPDAWAVIAHGIDTDQFARQSSHAGKAETAARLRIAIPGRLPPHKGLYLLREAMPALLGCATLLLLGCGKFGEPFRGVPGVEVVPDYEYAQLGEAIRRFDPDIALLLSVLPESFSYTLSEMLALGVPVAASRVGALPERIEHGRNGLLFEPDAQSLVETVQMLAKDRSRLLQLRQQARACPPRPAAAMVSDYHALFPEAGRSAARVDRSSSRSAFLRWLAALADERLQLRDENVGLVELARQAASHADVLAARIGELERRCQDLSRDADRLAADKAAIYRSRSWRLTAPLRYLADMVASVRTPRALSQGNASEGAPQPVEITRPAGGTAGAPGLAAESREAARRRLRYEIGVPDAARVVVGVIAETDCRAADCFVAMTSAILEARNDTVFVVLRPLVEDGRGDKLAQALLSATRKLFVLGPADQALAIEAADVVFVSTSGDRSIQPIETIASQAKRTVAFDPTPGLAPVTRSPRVSSASDASSIAAAILDGFAADQAAGCP